MDFELGQIRKTVKTKDISTTFVQYGGQQFSVFKLTPWPHQSHCSVNDPRRSQHVWLAPHVTNS